MKTTRKPKLTLFCLSHDYSTYPRAMDGETTSIFIKISISFSPASDMCGVSLRDPSLLGTKLFFYISWSTKLQQPMSNFGLKKVCVPIQHIPRESNSSSDVLLLRYSTSVGTGLFAATFSSLEGNLNSYTAHSRSLSSTIISR